MSSDDDFIVIDVVDSKQPKTSKKVKHDTRVTDATMTPNEYARLLSHRARQLKTGATPTIDWDGRFDPIAIAKEEISQRRIPLVIIRKIPDAKNETGFRDEIWDVKELNIRDF